MKKIRKYKTKSRCFFSISLCIIGLYWISQIQIVIQIVIQIAMRPLYNINVFKALWSLIKIKYMSDDTNNVNCLWIFTELLRLKHRRHKTNEQSKHIFFSGKIYSGRHKMLAHFPFNWSRFLGVCIVISQYFEQF